MFTVIGSFTITSPYSRYGQWRCDRGEVAPPPSEKFLIGRRKGRGAERGKKKREEEKRREERGRKREKKEKEKGNEKPCEES